MIEMTELEAMEERKNRQEETIKTFKEGLGNKRSNKNLIKNGEVDKDALLDALKLAFPDITPRTMRRDPAWSSTAGCVEFSQMSETLFTYSYKGKKFGDQLKDWFDKPYLADPEEWQKAFDEFHGIACETVMDFIKTQCYEPKCITYGKAQKVVNMTFKHIYCLDGAYNKEEWFIPCHIALDSFTLEWFCRNVKGVTKGCVDSWSALQNATDKNNKLPDRYADMKMYTKAVDKGDGKKSEINWFYTYEQIVALIRSYFAGDHPFKGLFPLQAEFYIWPEIQLHLAAETLYGQDAGKETTIDAAKDIEEWQEDWRKAQMDSKTIEQRFTWCKKKFKLLPVDKKLEFLNERVGQMIKKLHIYKPQ